MRGQFAKLRRSRVRPPAGAPRARPGGQPPAMAWHHLEARATVVPDIHQCWRLFARRKCKHGQAWEQVPQRPCAPPPVRARALAVLRRRQSQRPTPSVPTSARAPDDACARAVVAPAPPRAPARRPPARAPRAPVGPPSPPGSAPRARQTGPRSRRRRPWCNPQSEDAAGPRDAGDSRAAVRRGRGRGYRPRHQGAKSIYRTGASP